MSDDFVMDWEWLYKRIQARRVMSGIQYPRVDFLNDNTGLNLYEAIWMRNMRIMIRHTTSSMDDFKMLTLTLDNHNDFMISFGFQARVFNREKYIGYTGRLRGDLNE